MDNTQAIDITTLPNPARYMAAINAKPLTAAQLSGELKRAALPEKRYADALPNGLLWEHRDRLCKSMGLPVVHHDMVDENGVVALLTERERRAVGDMPLVQVRHMGATARARLVQIAENPSLLTEYLSSGMTATRLAALLDMTVGGLEDWVDSRGLMDEYAKGRLKGADTYFDRAQEAVQNLPDFTDDAMELADLMANSSPSDALAMEQIRHKEWRLGVLKAHGEYALKRSKLEFEGFLKLAAATAPERYAPRHSSTNEVANGSVTFNIDMRADGSAGHVVNGGHKAAYVAKNPNIIEGVTIDMGNGYKQAG